MKSLLTALLVLVPLYAFSQDAKMPAEAQKTIDKYEKAVADAQKVYDAAVTKAADAAKKDLIKIQETETKSGRLETALLVKQKIDGIQTPKTSSLPAPIPPTILLQIVSATWGPDGDKTRNVDITEQLQKLVENDSLTLNVDRNINKLVPEDPAPNVTKTITLVYKYNGVTRKAKFAEGQSISLPAKK